VRVLISVSATPAVNTTREFHLLKNGVDVATLCSITPSSGNTCDVTPSPAVPYSDFDTLTVLEWNAGSANGNAANVKILVFLLP
jgi:hypothetical protein